MDGDGVGDWRAGRPLVENWVEGAARSSSPSSSLVAATTIMLANGDLCHLGVIVVFGCSTCTDEYAIELERAIKAKAATDLNFPIVGG